jgi:hypothetical protein
MLNINIDISKKSVIILATKGKGVKNGGGNSGGNGVDAFSKNIL